MTTQETPKHTEEAQKEEHKKKAHKTPEVKKLAEFKTEGTNAVASHPAHPVKHEEPSPTPSEKSEEKADKKQDDKKSDKTDKKESKKPAKVVTKRKFEAKALGRSLPISKKHAMYICRFIKHKPIDQAIKELEQVIIMKRAIPFKGEIPHRKGAMMSGRYPVNASIEFITLLKGLKGNVLTNNMNLDKTRIIIASPSWAARPMRRSGRAGKRTHVMLRAREVEPKGGKK